MYNFDNIKDDTGILFDSDFKHLVEKELWKHITIHGTLNQQQTTSISREINQGALTRKRFQIAIHVADQIIQQHTQNYYAQLILAC